jgi:hypothetical protein
MSVEGTLETAGTVVVVVGTVVVAGGTDVVVVVVLGTVVVTEGVLALRRVRPGATSFASGGVCLAVGWMIRRLAKVATRTPIVRNCVEGRKALKPRARCDAPSAR